MIRTDDVKQVEGSIQRSKAALDLASSLDKLLVTASFKRVIESGYFEQEAIRLVHLKADPSQQDPVAQAAIVKQMDAIGSLKQYFTVIQHQGSLAAKSIAFDEATREELIAGGLDE